MPPGIGYGPQQGQQQFDLGGLLPSGQPALPQQQQGQFSRLMSQINSLRQQQLQNNGPIPRSQYNPAQPELTPGILPLEAFMDDLGNLSQRAIDAYFRQFQQGSLLSQLYFPTGGFQYEPNPSLVGGGLLQMSPQDIQSLIGNPQGRTRQQPAGFNIADIQAQQSAGNPPAPNIGDPFTQPPSPDPAGGSYTGFGDYFVKY